LEVNECYDELGLEPGSSDAQVKAAWRRLAAQWHPDRNDSPQALRKIQRINRALDGIRMSRSSGRSGVPDDAAADIDPDVEADVEHIVQVSLEEVVTGCARELRGELKRACADCEGAGVDLEPTSCTECGGEGRVRQNLWLAWMSPWVKCAACDGHGATRQACASCEGSGKAPPQRYRFRVDIPAGARTGDQIDCTARVQGSRESVAVCVRVEVKPHPLFAVEPDGTLKCEMPVDGFLWTANRWVDVPSPRGLQQMKLKRGSLSYRIKGAGLPWQEDGSPSDCIVTVAPVFPEVFSAAQEAAIDQLVAANSGQKASDAGQRIAAWKHLVACSLHPQQRT
jgi:molecular chaperone DnaJ